MVTGPDGRDESPSERADRNWNDLLQEFRVLQTGVQLLSGFLLTLPFHSTFADLDHFQKGLYLALVLLAACATVTMLTPIAVHRRVFQQLRKPQLVRIGHRVVKVALGLIAALVAGTAFFVFDLVTNRTVAVAVGAVMLALVALALLALPARVANRD